MISRLIKSVPCIMLRLFANNSFEKEFHTKEDWVTEIVIETTPHPFPFQRFTIKSSFRILRFKSFNVHKDLLFFDKKHFV